MAVFPSKPKDHPSVRRRSRRPKELGLTDRGDPLDSPKAASVTWVSWAVADLQDADPFRLLRHCLGDVRFAALVEWMNTAGQRLLHPLTEEPQPAPSVNPVEHAQTAVRGAIDVVVDLLGTALTNPGTRLSLRPRQDQDDRTVMRAAAAVEQAIRTFDAIGLSTKRLRDALNEIIIASRMPFIRPDDIDAVIEQVHGPQPKQSGKGDPLRLVFQVGRVFQTLTTGTCLPNVDWEAIPAPGRTAVTCGICGGPANQSHGRVADKDARFLLAELLNALGIAPEPKTKAANESAPTQASQSATVPTRWKDTAIKRLLERFKEGTCPRNLSPPLATLGAYGRAATLTDRSKVAVARFSGDRAAALVSTNLPADGALDVQLLTYRRTRGDYQLEPAPSIADQTRAFCGRPVKRLSIFFISTPVQRLVTVTKHTHYAHVSFWILTGTRPTLADVLTYDWNPGGDFDVRQNRNQLMVTHPMQASPALSPICSPALNIVELRRHYMVGTSCNFA